MENLELLVSQLAEISHLNECLRPVSEDYAQFKEKLILDGNIATDTFILFSQLFRVYFFFSDYPVGGFDFFLFEDFQKTKEDVMQSRKVKIVVMIFLSCENLVKYFEFLKDIFFKIEAMFIYSFFLELLKLLFEEYFILTEYAYDFLS